MSLKREVQQTEFDYLKTYRYLLFILIRVIEAMIEK